MFRENTETKMVYTVDEVAEVLGLSRNTVYEAVHRKEIPSIKIGRRIIIPKRALEEALSLAAQEIR